MIRRSPLGGTEQGLKAVRHTIFELLPKNDKIPRCDVCKYVLYIFSKVNLRVKVIDLWKMSNKGLSSPNHSTRILVLPEKVLNIIPWGFFYSTSKIGGSMPIWNGDNFALEGRTKLNNHLKMIRRVTLCGADEGSKSLKPLLFEIWVTPKFKPTILAENRKIYILSDFYKLGIFFRFFDTRNSLKLLFLR